MQSSSSSQAAISVWSLPCRLILVLSVIVSGVTWAQSNSGVSTVLPQAQPVTPAADIVPAVTPGFLPSHTPSQVLSGTARLVSHYGAAQKLRLALAIQPPDMAGEETFIQQLVTKKSPNFHKFLSSDEWNARFGPSVEDEQKVVDWAESQGLTVTHRYPNRLLVDVEGTVDAIEKAFGVTINNYQVGNEVDFSNDRDPAVPDSLSGILHAVVGLNNIERVHRIGSRKPTVKGADYVSGPAVSEPGNSHGDGDPTRAPVTRAAPMTRAVKEKAGALASNPRPEDSYPLDYRSGTYAMDPDNIQSSEGYDFNALQALSFCCNVNNVSTGAPAVSSIALVGYGAFNVSDVQTFFGAYGMAYNLSWYCLGGSPCPGVDGEAPLDVEYSGAMSNSYGSYLDTAQIFEYEMTNNLYTTYADTFNQIVSDDHAKVVSTSYGWEENVGFSGSQATGTMHPIFNNMVGTGWTLIAASGDNGASDGCGSTTRADYPSTDPDFIAAGGTQLSMNTSGIYESETAWQGEFWSGACGSNHGGSTGGVSVLFAAPYWQSPILSPYYEWVGSTEYVVTGNANRLVPDISLTANPDVLGQWYYAGGSWQDEGGTSIVAPELAGFFAQENTYLNYIGNVCGSGGTSACTPVGLASPFMYYDAIDGAPHNPFYDMTSGCNNNDITTADGLVYYCAGTGYDLVTGWGSANMLQLAWGINWELIPAYGQPSISFGGPATNTWYNSDQLVDWDVSDAGSGGFPAPGVAGYTQGWDSIPSDPYSEPGGGQGNSFYSGPQHAFGTFGCTDLSGSLCTGGPVSQGCHTVWVEAWDNQGRNATSSYGPVCYDTVSPVTTASLSGTLNGSEYVNSVTITLHASDPSPGSGIKNTHYQVNGGALTTYSGPFAVKVDGASTVTFYSTDVAGNVESTKSVGFGVTSTTTTSVISSLNPAASGKTVKFTATVSSSLGAVATGKVSFMDGATVLGTGTLSGGVASHSISSLALGSHTITATFLGSTYFEGSAASLTEVIENSTTTTLTSSANPSEYGQSVTFTATIGHSSGTPTGTVTFENGSAVLGTVAVSGGKATYSTAALTVSTGGHSIKAIYSGDSNFSGSTSAVLKEVVNKATTSTKVVSSLNPSTSGQTVTFTATVKPSTSGTATGSVQFYDGTTLLGSHGLSGGVATYATSKLAAGSHSITAVYVGNGDYTTSTSSAIKQVVNP